jgi:hypothetical protein
MQAYDFKKVNLILTVNGQQIYITGFASGSTIDVAHKSDKYTPHIGAKGDVSYAKSNDQSGTITFKTKSDSPSNPFLYSLDEADDEFDVLIVDGNDIGASKVNSSQCVMQKPADYTRGSDIQALTWTIGCAVVKTTYNS